MDSITWMANTRTKKSTGTVEQNRVYSPSRSPKPNLGGGGTVGVSESEI